MIDRILHRKVDSNFVISEGVQTYDVFVESVVEASKWQKRFVTLPAMLGGEIKSFCSYYIRFKGFYFSRDATTRETFVILSEPVYAFSEEEKVFASLNHTFSDATQIKEQAEKAGAWW